MRIKWPKLAKIASVTVIGLVIIFLIGCMIEDVTFKSRDLCQGLTTGDLSRMENYRSDSSFRKESLQHLAKYPHRRMLALYFIRRYKHGQDEIAMLRVSAAYAKLSQAEAMPLLIPLLKSKDNEVAKEAASLLRVVCKSKISEGLIQTATVELSEAIDKPTKLARAAEAQGKWKAAASSWKRVVALSPSKHEAIEHYSACADCAAGDKVLVKLDGVNPEEISLSEVEISGSVVNNLPWPVRNVRISVDMTETRYGTVPIRMRQLGLPEVSDWITVSVGCIAGSQPIPPRSSREFTIRVHLPRARAEYRQYYIRGQETVEPLVWAAIALKPQYEELR